MFKCPNCHKQFKTKEELVKHVNENKGCKTRVFHILLDAGIRLSEVSIHFIEGE